MGLGQLQWIIAEALDWLLASICSAICPTSWRRMLNRPLFGKIGDVEWGH